MKLLIQLFMFFPKLSVLRESSKVGLWRHGREGQLSQLLLLAVPLVTITVQCWYCQLCIPRTTCWLKLLQLQLKVQTQQFGQIRSSSLTVWRILSHVKDLVRKIQLSWSWTIGSPTCQSQPSNGKIRCHYLAPSSVHTKHITMLASITEWS
jgi:hypothetical protein